MWLTFSHALTMAGALGIFYSSGATRLTTPSAFPADCALTRALTICAQLALAVAATTFWAHLSTAVKACIPGMALADATFTFSVVVAIVDARNLFAVLSREANVTETLAVEAVAVVRAGFSEALVLSRLGVKARKICGVFR